MSPRTVEHPDAMPVGTSSLRYGRFGLTAVLVAAFVGAALFGVLVTRLGGFATIWLANGFLAGALILAPAQRRWVLAACFAAEAAIALAVGDSVIKALVFPAINLTEASVAAWLAVRFCGARMRRVSLRELSLLLVAAIVPAAILGGAAGAVANLAMRGEGLIEGWLDWAIPDALGMAIVIPTVLLMTRIGHYPEFRRSLLEVLGELGGLSVLTAAIYSQQSLPVLFVLFPALTLIAVRLGPPGAAVATMLVAVIALPLTMFAGGPPALSPLLDGLGRVRLTELVVAAALFSSMATAVSVAEQSRLRTLMLRRDQAARAARARARAAERALLQQSPSAPAARRERVVAAA